MSEPSGQFVRVGQLLAQRYRVERRIGEGGVGAVFLAQDLELERSVAIKVLKRAPFGDPLAAERFQREIRATMAIACEYVVRTLGVGALDDGAPFMVMEFHDACDLSAAILERGPLPVELAVEFALQTCVALAHAHRLGIVHRDIKPANLLLIQRAGREQIKVLDFGISKFTSDLNVPASKQLTGNAVRLGSPLYMSPEQRSFARGVDERTDIWSLGITLFEMIAGAVPFDSSPQSIRGEREVPSTVPSVSRYRPETPAALDLVIARCLQRLPERRYRNVAELAAALVAFGPPSAASLAREVAAVRGAAGASPSPDASSSYVAAAIDGLRRETTAIASAPSESEAPTAMEPADWEGLKANTTLGPSIGAARLEPRRTHWHLARRYLAAFLALLAVIAFGSLAYRRVAERAVLSTSIRKLDAMPDDHPFLGRVRRSCRQLAFPRRSIAWSRLSAPLSRDSSRSAQLPGPTNEPSLVEPSVQTSQPPEAPRSDSKPDVGY